MKHIWLQSRIRSVVMALVVLPLAFLFVNIASIRAQVPGDLPLPPAEANDSVMVFLSPRPLIAEENLDGGAVDVWGLDLLFSGNGFGLGFFYRHEYTPDFFGFAHLGFSVAKNTDEIEQYSREIGWYVPGKVNRLFMMPVTIGVQRRLFSDDLSDSFKPYLQAGAGGAFILSTPYEQEFFSAFGDADCYFRPGGFVGVGAYVGEGRNSLTAVNVRYYFIPFGGDGLESIRDYPIKDFGGLFLSLSVGLIH